MTLSATDFLPQRWLAAKFRINVGIVSYIVLSIMLILGYILQLYHIKYIMVYFQMILSFIWVTIFNLCLLKIIDYLILSKKLLKLLGVPCSAF